MIGIYKFTNLINNKVYIGQSQNINKRIKEHFYKSKLESGQDYFSLLHMAIRKYGEENFKTEILQECSIEELDELEKYYIQLYNSITPNGYNILSGGQSYRVEPKRCLQCGKVISKNSVLSLCITCYKESRKSNRPSKEELYNILIEYNGNFTQVGKLFNISSSAIVKWCKGYDLPYHSGDYKTISQKKPYKIAVNQIDKDTGEIIATYESSMAAARALGKTKGSHITEVCKGINKTAYGYKWEYVK